ncbi:MAG: DUF1592 domain-containing protein [Myxococcota bacterium]
MSFWSCTGTIGDTGPSLLGGAALLPQTIRAPLRRLTRREYDNTVRDLLGDTTSPARALPSEEIGNGFGNDASSLSMSTLLAEQYANVAEDVATRATATAEALARWAPCVVAAASADEESCMRATLASFLPLAFRRPVEQAEVDELVLLQKEVRDSGTYAGSVAAVLEAILQSPDFLYRIELGEPDPEHGDRRRLTAHEMATRLSYLFWGTTPDPGLRGLAASNDLSTPEQVRAQAALMLDDPRARPMVRTFFNGLLPVAALGDAHRDAALFPRFNATIASLMRQETEQFAEHVIFEGEGDWVTLMTAPYTMVNDELAAYYGMSAVSGSAFRKAAVDTTKRRGLLLLGGVLTGTTHSNHTSPVTRGAYVMRKMMCVDIPLPPSELADKITPPPPYSAPTARERFSQHSVDPVCATCHQLMDPVGFTLENFDAVGMWRNRENDVTIDASGKLPGYEEGVGGPVDLVNAIAASEDGPACFTRQWLSFAYGRSFDTKDKGTLQAVTTAFADGGYDIKELVLAFTQTDSFLYLPREPE